ncbi:MAG: methyltransferase domain-containing protein [Saprospiraceae bacterium]|nr:methyltransferase domain-containing protein [Saprospiraceae bacterium]
MGLDKNFWDKRWEEGQTGWDIGYPSTPLVEYMKQYPDHSDSILIPGCGNAYEANALYELGFHNITLLDISPTACKTLSERFGGWDGIKVVCDDFFSHEGNYDLILEQTFFCALDPVLRESYVKKSASLLGSRGKLVGLLFASHFNAEGPPFGGTAEEYKALFEPFFHIRKMEPCNNSIPARMGNELWMELNLKI